MYERAAAAALAGLA
ncbi:hypothetical protein [Corynebacterium tuberculostearicum]